MNIIYHNHHILPRHAGGTDDPSNLIRLSVEDHAEAHRLLYEEHGRWQDKCAWMALAGMIGKEEILREVYRQNGIRAREMLAGVPLSEERKEVIRQHNLGKRQSESTRSKKSKVQCGMKKSDDFGEKIREARKSLPKQLMKGVMAMGESYRSMRAAAVATGYSHTSVRGFCNDPRIKDFYFIS